ncbi:MAG: glutathione peroxidase [Caulobacteraceae bacterium]|nr:glutathione peroxidase [Caulobacteraceae bacterium]
MLRSIALSAFVATVAFAAPTDQAGAAESVPAVAYGFHFTDIEGGNLSMEQFRGKVVLVVNTASQCGFTPQYDGLEKLYTDYKAKGFVILGVPSNDFGGQEPGSNAEIKKFCSVNFNIDFPMAAKAVVKGDKAHPFYKWTKAKLGSQAEPKWNFHKILIGRDGQPIAGFGSMVKPSDKVLLTAINKAL